jgi:hypothetical protein
MRRLLWVLLVVGLISACTDGDTAGTAESTQIRSSTTSALETTTLPPSSTIPSTTATTTSLPDGPSIVQLAVGPAAIGPVSGAANPDGFPAVAYVSSDGELRLLTCSDVACEGPISVKPLGNPGEPLELDLKLRSDGSPTVVVLGYDTGFAVMYSCTDASCNSVETAEVGDHDGMIDYPRLVVGIDGLPRVVYVTRTEPMAVKVATCTTATCDSLTWSGVDVLPPQVFTGGPAVRLAPDGRLFIGYWLSKGYESQQSRVAVCDDASCSTSPTILTFDGAVFAQTTPGDTDDEFRVWYQTGSESLPPELMTEEAMAGGFASIWADYSDFMVAECTLEGCNEERKVDVGEDWLLAQTQQALRLHEATDGTISTFFNHESRGHPLQLHTSICIDAVCSDGATHALGLDSALGPFFDVIYPPYTPTQLVYLTYDQGIHLYNCPNQSCAP